MLQLLREHRLLATFCLVGQQAAAYPELVREIAADGHTLCNHSWDHDFGLGSRSRAAIRADLQRTTAAILPALAGRRLGVDALPPGVDPPRTTAGSSHSSPGRSDRDRLIPGRPRYRP